MQSHADVLLTFLWDGGTVDGVFSTKLFEYAGAGRPILAIGQQTSDVSRIIESAQLGRVAAEGTAVADALAIWAGQKARIGQLRAEPSSVNDFSRRIQFESLEKHMQTLIAKRA